MQLQRYCIGTAEELAVVPAGVVWCGVVWSGAVLCAAS